MEHISLIVILLLMSTALVYAFIREHYYEIRYSLQVTFDKVLQTLHFSRAK